MRGCARLAAVGVAWLGWICSVWLSLSSRGQQVSLGRLSARWRRNTRWETQFPVGLRLHSWTITCVSFGWSKQVTELRHTAKAGKAPLPPKRHGKSVDAGKGHSLSLPQPLTNYLHGDVSTGNPRASYNIKHNKEVLTHVWNIQKIAYISITNSLVSTSDN